MELPDGFIYLGIPRHEFPQITILYLPGVILFSDLKRRMKELGHSKPMISTISFKVYLVFFSKYLDLSILS